MVGEPERFFQFVVLSLGLHLHFLSRDRNTMLTIIELQWFMGHNQNHIQRRSAWQSSVYHDWKHLS